MNRYSRTENHLPGSILTASRRGASASNMWSRPIARASVSGWLRHLASWRFRPFV